MCLPILGQQRQQAQPKQRLMLLEHSCARLAVLEEVRSKGLEAACFQAAHGCHVPVPAAGLQQLAACAAGPAEHAAFAAYQAADSAAERPAGGLGTHLHANAADP